MSYIEKLASMVVVRNFLMSADENVQYKMSISDSRALRTKISEIDKAIVELALKFEPMRDATATEFKSSVDVDQVMTAIFNTPSTNEELEDLDQNEAAITNQKNQNKNRAGKPTIIKHG